MTFAAWLRALAARGGRVSRLGPDRAMAACPAHEDRTPSLSVRDAGDRVLLHCHAGCPTEAILAALGLVAADLFTAPASTSPPSREATVVATYVYRDRDGTPRYEILRLRDRDGRKRFLARRPDGAGGWVWGLDGVARCLYRWPEIHGQRGVWIVEGEKDADRLAAAGLPATTAPHGAGRWRDEYARDLRAGGTTHVAIVPDADAPGWAHAQQVAASCARLGLVPRVVTLSDVDAHGDVSDWLDRGHTIEELRALVRQTPVWTPSTRAPAPPPTTFVQRVVAEIAAEAVTWIWPDRLARGELTLVAGDPGAGKTWWLLWLAAQISTGAAWPDGSPGTVGEVWLALAEDAPAQTVRPRLERMGADLRRITLLEAVRDEAGRPRPIDLVRDGEALVDLVRTHRPALLGLDPILAYVGQTETARDVEVRRALAPLREAAQAAGTAIVMIAHLTKDTQRSALYRPSSSIALVALPRLVHAIAALPQTPQVRAIASVKNNLGPLAPTLAYRVTERGLEWLEGTAWGAWTAEQLLAARRPDPHAIEAQTVVAEWLAEPIWPLPDRELLRLARLRGLPIRAVRSALYQAHCRPRGLGASVVWERPTGGAEGAS